jgi:hypothetical protein
VIGAIQHRSRSRAEQPELSGCELSLAGRATAEPHGEATKLVLEAPVKEISAPYPAREGQGARFGLADGTGPEVSSKRCRGEALIKACRQSTQG